MIGRHSPLIFRQDGSLDFGPLTLAVTSVIGLLMFILDACRIVHVSIAAWSYLGAFTSMAFIAGAAAERAYWISRSPVPGAVAQGIASSPPLDTDDGRDDDTAHMSKLEARA